VHTTGAAVAFFPAAQNSECALVFVFLFGLPSLGWSQVAHAA
jgi:hypothetical protein